MEDLLFWIQQYGYFALFLLLVLGIVGLPIPDETLLTISGFLIYKGNFSLIPTFITALLGSIVGITISYILGRLAGHFIIERYGSKIGLTKKKMDTVHWWYQKFGRWTLLIGYFIPGIRHFTALIAGMSYYEAPSFALFAYTGALIWVSTFLSLGYFVGDKWKDILAQLELQSDILVLIGIAIVIALSYYFYRKYKAPRSKDNTAPPKNDNPEVRRQKSEA